VLTIDYQVKYSGRTNMGEFMGTFRSADGTPLRTRLDRKERAHPGWLEGPDDREAMPDGGVKTGHLARAVLAVTVVAWAIAQPIWWVHHRLGTR
jgi:hypothetical protein